MSPIQQKPILHGRDHCPGGADPIPCMITGPSGGDFEGILLATGPYAYWRLGETGTPWADTSGVSPAADLAETASGTALTPDVTGALEAGDDGAVEFNYDGSSSSGGRYLHQSAGKEFDMSPNGEMSVCAWVKVKASALTRRGVIIGNSLLAVSGGDHQSGWALQVVYPGRAVRFTRGQIGGFGFPELYAETTGGVVADEWTFFVGTYDGANIKLYANAELVDTTADASGANWSADHIRIGAGSVAANLDSWLYGTVDEAAVWDRALSQTEINALYAAGVSGALAGWVLTTDGSGGTTWAAPTLEVEF